MNEALSRLIETETALPVSPDVRALVAAITAKGYAAGILFYGSGLWKDSGADTVYDFYVLADRFRDFDASLLRAALGAALPPNVYYLELPHEGRILRCKYALMTIAQFEKAARGQTLTPQIWARFAQPCRIVYARTDTARKFLIEALTDAVETFHRKTWPLVKAGAGPREIWLTGLSATYNAELRSEPPGRAAMIYDANKAAFDARTAAVMPLTAADLSKTPKFLLKSVTFLRLLKATLTFDGAVDYALWKIERQSGVVVTASDFQKRHPLIGAWPLVWKIYRRGGFR